MQISLDTGQAGIDELTALIALLASLGGRLPHDHPAPVTVTTTTRPAPPPPAAPSASEQAEALIQQEAARVAGAAPPPPADDDSGPAVDPTTLDKDGIPWDARIHAGTKTQNKDGTWKKLRNVDEVLYGQVHAELQEKYAGNHGTGTPNNGAASTASGIAGAPDASNPASSTPAAPPPPPADAGNAPAAPTPPAESAPTAAASTSAENASAAGRFADFPGFVQAVNSIRTPSIPYLELNQTAASLGVAGGFKDMKDRPDLWETFYGMAGGQ